MRTTRTTARKTWLWITLTAVLVLVLPVDPASAQDPYGETTTTTGPVGLLPSCDIGVTSAQSGDLLQAVVGSVPWGQTVQIRIAGVVVAEGTAALAGPNDDGESTTVTVPFTVPQLSVGSYLVTAVGVGFTVACGPDPAGLLDVLASNATNPPGGGTLPFTGTDVALLLAVAAVLLLVGRVLLSRSRRRAESSDTRDRHSPAEPEPERTSTR